MFLAARLFEYKFYPIFCFCPGYGFAVPMRRCAARGENVRVRFTYYLNGGCILRRHIRKGPRALLNVAKFWLAVTVFAGIAIAFIGGVSSTSEVTLPAQNEIAAQDSERVFTCHTESGYVHAATQRMEDFFTVTATYVLVRSPVMLFFPMGAIAAQRKWRRYPARHQSFRRRVFWFELHIGLPTGIAHAVSQMAAASEPWMPASLLLALAASFAPVLALAFVAGFAPGRANAQGDVLIPLLAAARCIALTLYIGQSVLMMLLLKGFGWGLGLAATFRQFELFVSATVLYALLLLVVHLMQHVDVPAPLDIICRRYTNAANSCNKNA